jgi:multidrug efflux pump subunit AcrB
MKKLIKYFIERSLVVNLITVMIFIVGTISIITLQKETFPRVDFDVIIVTTSYPGSSAEDVEKLISISLERELKSVEGIKEITALSAQGNSIVYIKVDPDADVDEVLNDCKDAIDSVDDLPEEAKIPKVRSLTNKARGVLKIPLTGLPYAELRKHAKKIQKKLEIYTGVARVNFDGYRLDEIVIIIDPDKMNQYEITTTEISTAIRNKHLNLSAGKLESLAGDIIVRTISEFVTTDDIKKLILRSNDSGRSVTLSDVATVVRRPAKSTILVRSQGKQSIFLDVKIKENADILINSKIIKEAVKEYMQKVKDTGLQYSFVDDTSFKVNRRLNVLKSNGFVGIILVFICLLFFLNFSTSVITSLGAPIAFMTAFILMDSFGLSINLISMFGLILVLGMLVDDSIIVAEHYYQLLERGMRPKEAALKAAMDTIGPVTATILTTVVAFGAIFFMGGIMGKFLWSVPAVVIICLAASWLECFFILPSHLHDFVRLKKDRKEKKWFNKLIEKYDVILKFSLKYPKIILASFFIVFIFSIGVARNMRFELFPGDDVSTIYLQVKGEVGTALNKTDDAVKKIEKMFLAELKKDEIEQIKAYVGMLQGNHGQKTGSHYGQVVAYLTDPKDRERSTDEIVKVLVEKAKKLVPDFSVISKKLAGGPPKGKPVEIDLKSDSLEELKIVSKLVHTELKKEKGLTSSELDFEEGKKQIIIEVNDQEARRLGLNTRQVAFEFRAAMAGDSVTEIRENDEDIEIKINLNADSQNGTEVLSKLYIVNNQGSRIPMSKVAKFRELPGAFVIRRFNRQRIFSISGTLDNAITSPRKIVETFKPKLDAIMENYPDVFYSFGGENKDTNESMMRLAKSGIIALFCIFLILVFMFASLGQPLVIMSAIPLGMIGVIFTFKLFDMSLGFMAMMGVVALVGVVVNDSIVLVSFINERLRETSDSLYTCIIEGSKSRFRPVILTTFTTVAGLLPVAHWPGGDPFLKPMATSFAWGLLIATAVTLVFIPCNYFIYTKIINWFKKKFEKGSSAQKNLSENEQVTATRA